MKTKKRVVFGWIARNPFDPLFFEGDHRLVTEIYEFKQTQQHWGKSSWPPVKVKITMEEVK